MTFETMFTVWKIGFYCYIFLMLIYMRFHPKIRAELESSLDEFGLTVTVVISIIATLIVAAAWPVLLVMDVLNLFRRR